MTDYRTKYLALQSRLDQCESLLRDGVALMDATKEIIIMMANAIALHNKEHPESKVTVTDKRLWKIVQEMQEKGWLKKK